jgi:hypothetical protein
MADQDARMVLRTVYLTPEVDEKLRVGAFQAGRSKNDLIRDHPVSDGVWRVHEDSIESCRDWRHQKGDSQEGAGETPTSEGCS